MLKFWPTCEVFSMVITLAQMFQLKQSDLRYILQWSGPNNEPNQYLGNGLQMFVQANCSFANCYVTSDKRYFYGTDDFDAIIFDVKDLQQLDIKEFPPKRCWRQKYILSATEAADVRPICPKYSLDNFFNWTWTYKLNSDLPRPYLTIFEKEGEPIGPSLYMPWVLDQYPTTSSVTKQLQDKNKAVAWFVDECHTKSKREAMVKQLSLEMEKFDLYVDIYGQCGSKPCSEEKPKCQEMLRKHYFFYLTFENSLAPDFVTGSVVTAFDNFVVPIVYGKADYNRFSGQELNPNVKKKTMETLTPIDLFPKYALDLYDRYQALLPGNDYMVLPLKFLPPGSYLDAKLLGPQRLAREIVDSISNQTRYKNYFRWRNHYEITRNELNTDVCGLCAIMNEPELLLEETTYTSIQKWFNIDSKECTQDKVHNIASKGSFEDKTAATPKPNTKAVLESLLKQKVEKSPKNVLNLTLSEDDSNTSEYS